MFKNTKKRVSTVNKLRLTLIYRPFHKTLPRSSALVNWTSVRYYETDCITGGYQYIFYQLVTTTH